MNTPTQDSANLIYSSSDEIKEEEEFKIKIKNNEQTDKNKEENKDQNAIRTKNVWQMLRKVLPPLNIIVAHQVESYNDFIKNMRYDYKTELITTISIY